MSEKASIAHLSPLLVHADCLVPLFHIVENQCIDIEGRFLQLLPKDLNLLSWSVSEAEAVVCLQTLRPQTVKFLLHHLSFFSPGKTKLRVSPLDILTTLCIFSMCDWEVKTKYLFRWFNVTKTNLLDQDEHVSLIRTVAKCLKKIKLLGTLDVSMDDAKQAALNARIVYDTDNIPHFRPGLQCNELLDWFFHSPLCKVILDFSTIARRVMELIRTLDSRSEELQRMVEMKHENCIIDLPMLPFPLKSALARQSTVILSHVLDESVQFLFPSSVVNGKMTLFAKVEKKTAVDSDYFNISADIQDRQKLLREAKNRTGVRCCDKYILETSFRHLELVSPSRESGVLTRFQLHGLPLHADLVLTLYNEKLVFQEVSVRTLERKGSLDRDGTDVVVISPAVLTEDGPLSRLVNRLYSTEQRVTVLSGTPMVPVESFFTQCLFPALDRMAMLTAALPESAGSSLQPLVEHCTRLLRLCCRKSVWSSAQTMFHQYQASVSGALEGPRCCVSGQRVYAPVNVGGLIGPFAAVLQHKAQLIHPVLASMLVAALEREYSALVAQHVDPLGGALQCGRCIVMHVAKQSAAHFQPLVHHTLDQATATIQEKHFYSSFHRSGDCPSFVLLVRDPSELFGCEVEVDESQVPVVPVPEPIPQEKMFGRYEIIHGEYNPATATKSAEEKAAENERAVASIVQRYRGFGGFLRACFEYLASSSKGGITASVTVVCANWMSGRNFVVTQKQGEEVTGELRFVNLCPCASVVYPKLPEDETSSSGKNNGKKKAKGAAPKDTRCAQEKEVDALLQEIEGHCTTADLSLSVVREPDTDVRVMHLQVTTQGSEMKFSSWQDMGLSSQTPPLAVWEDNPIKEEDKKPVDDNIMRRMTPSERAAVFAQREALAAAVLEASPWSRVSLHKRLIAAAPHHSHTRPLGVSVGQLRCVLCSGDAVYVEATATGLGQLSCHILQVPPSLTLRDAKALINSHHAYLSSVSLRRQRQNRWVHHSGLRTLASFWFSFHNLHPGTKYAVYLSCSGMHYPTPIEVVNGYLEDRHSSSALISHVVFAHTAEPVRVCVPSLSFALLPVKAVDYGAGVHYPTLRMTMARHLMDTAGFTHSRGHVLAVSPHERRRKHRDGFETFADASGLGIAFSSESSFPGVSVQRHGHFCLLSVFDDSEKSLANAAEFVSSRFFGCLCEQEALRCLIVFTASPLAECMRIRSTGPSSRFLRQGKWFTEQSAPSTHRAASELVEALLRWEWGTPGRSCRVITSGVVEQPTTIFLTSTKAPAHSSGIAVFVFPSDVAGQLPELDLNKNSSSVQEASDSLLVLDAVDVTESGGPVSPLTPQLASGPNRSPVSPARSVGAMSPAKGSFFPEEGSFASTTASFSAAVDVKPTEELQYWLFPVGWKFLSDHVVFCAQQYHDSNHPWTTALSSAKPHDQHLTLDSCLTTQRSKQDWYAQDPAIQRNRAVFHTVDVILAGNDHNSLLLPCSAEEVKFFASYLPFNLYQHRSPLMRQLRSNDSAAMTPWSMASALSSSPDLMQVTLGPIVGQVTSKTARVLFEFSYPANRVLCQLRFLSISEDGAQTSSQELVSYATVDQTESGIEAWKPVVFAFSDLAPDLKYDIILPELYPDRVLGTFNTLPLQCNSVELVFTADHSFASVAILDDLLTDALCRPVGKPDVPLLQRLNQLLYNFRSEEASLKSHADPTMVVHRPNTWQFLTEAIEAADTGNGIKSVFHLGPLVPLAEWRDQLWERFAEVLYQHSKAILDSIIADCEVMHHFQLETLEAFLRGIFRLLLSTPVVSAALSKVGHLCVHSPKYFLPADNVGAAQQAEARALSEAAPATWTITDRDQLLRRMFEHQLQLYVHSLYKDSESDGKATKEFYRSWRQASVVVALVDILSQRKKNKAAAASKGSGSPPPSKPKKPPAERAEAANVEDAAEDEKEEDDAAEDTYADELPANNKNDDSNNPKSGFSPGFLDRKQWQHLRVYASDNTILHLVMVFPVPLISLLAVPDTTGQALSKNDTTLAHAAYNDEMVPWRPTKEDLDKFLQFWIDWMMKTKKDSTGNESKSVLFVCSAPVPFSTLIQDMRTGFKIYQLCVGEQDLQFPASAAGVGDDEQRRAAAEKCGMSTSDLVLSGKIGGHFRYVHHLGGQDFYRTEPSGMLSSTVGVATSPTAAANDATSTKTAVVASSASGGNLGGTGNVGFARMKLYLDTWNPMTIWSNMNLLDIRRKEMHLGDAQLLLGPILGMPYRRRRPLAHAGGEEEDEDDAPMQLLEGSRKASRSGAQPETDDAHDHDGDVYVPLMLEVDRRTTLRLDLRATFRHHHVVVERELMVANRTIVLELGPLHMHERYRVRFTSGVHLSSLTFQREFIINTHSHPEESNFVVLNCASPGKTVSPASALLTELRQRSLVPFHGINGQVLTQWEPDCAPALRTFMNQPLVIEAADQSIRKLKHHPHAKLSEWQLPSLIKQSLRVLHSLRETYRETLSGPSLRDLLRMHWNLFVPQGEALSYTSPQQQPQTGSARPGGLDHESLQQSIQRLLQLLERHVAQEYLDLLRAPDAQVHRVLFPMHHKDDQERLTRLSSHWIDDHHDEQHHHEEEREDVEEVFHHFVSREIDAWNEPRPALGTAPPPPSGSPKSPKVRSKTILKKQDEKPVEIPMVPAPVTFRLLWMSTKVATNQAASKKSKHRRSSSADLHAPADGAAAADDSSVAADRLVVESLLAAWAQGCVPAPLEFTPFKSLNGMTSIERMSPVVSPLSAWWATRQLTRNLLAPSAIVKHENEDHAHADASAKHVIRLVLMADRDSAAIDTSLKLIQATTNRRPLSESLSSPLLHLHQWKQKHVQHEYMLVSMWGAVGSTVVRGFFSVVTQAVPRPPSGADDSPAVSGSKSRRSRKTRVDKDDGSSSAKTSATPMTVYCLDSVYRSNVYDRRFLIAELERKMPKKRLTAAAAKSKRAQQKKEEEERAQREQIRKQVQEILSSQKPDGYLFIHSRTLTVVTEVEQPPPKKPSAAAAAAVASTASTKAAAAEAAAGDADVVDVSTSARGELTSVRLDESGFAPVGEAAPAEATAVADTAAATAAAASVSPRAPTVPEEPVDPTQPAKLITTTHSDGITCLLPYYLGDPLAHENPALASTVALLQAPSKFQFVQLPRWFQCYFPVGMKPLAPGERAFIQPEVDPNVVLPPTLTTSADNLAPLHLAPPHIVDDVLLLLRQLPHTQVAAWFLETDVALFQRFRARYDKSRVSELSRPEDLREVDLSQPETVAFFLIDTVKSLWKEDLSRELRRVMLPLTDPMVAAFCLSRAATVLQATPTMLQQMPDVPAGVSAMPMSTTNVQPLHFLQNAGYFAVLMQQLCLTSMAMRLSAEMVSLERYHHVLDAPDLASIRVSEIEAVERRLETAKRRRVAEKAAEKAMEALLDGLGGGGSKSSGGRAARFEGGDSGSGGGGGGKRTSNVGRRETKTAAAAEGSSKTEDAETKAKKAEEELAADPLLQAEFARIREDAERHLTLDYESDVEELVHEAAKAKSAEDGDVVESAIRRTANLDDDAANRPGTPRRSKPRAAAADEDEDDGEDREVNQDMMTELQQQRGQWEVQSLTLVTEKTLDATLEEVADRAVALLWQDLILQHMTPVTEAERKAQAYQHVLRLGDERARVRRLYGTALHEPVQEWFATPTGTVDE